MDPIIIVPVALAVAWAATRKKKKTTKKTEPLPTVLDEPVEPLPPPPTHDDPFGPFDGPGNGGEPWRPGGPGQVGPKPFPGPSGGPKPPEYEDPSPVEIYPGTTAAEIEQHANAGYALFISSDCETIFEGESWYAEMFLPRARELVLGYPKAFHHPVAVIYELLVYPQLEDAPDEPETPTQACVAAWGEFVYGDRTPLGTFSGWISERSDPYEEYGDYMAWFQEEYPELSDLLWTLYTALWTEPELSEVFDRAWPEDEAAGEIDFDQGEG